MATSPEFVKISAEELRYGEKSFLQAQLGLLAILKRFAEYRKLRKEEFMLKIVLKSHTKEAKQVVKELDSHLPTIEHKEDTAFGKAQLREIEEEELTLEQEIEQVRKRLEKFQEFA